MKAYIRSDNASAYFVRQVLPVNPEAETPGEEELPHEHLGLGVLRADPRHDRGALLFGVDVRHGGTSRSVNQRALEARVAGDAGPRPAGTAPPLQFYESRPARLPAAPPPDRQPARAPRARRPTPQKHETPDASRAAGVHSSVDRLPGLLRLLGGFFIAHSPRRLIRRRLPHPRPSGPGRPAQPAPPRLLPGSGIPKGRHRPGRCRASAGSR